MSNVTIEYSGVIIVISRKLAQLGNRIRAHGEARNISQEALAEQCAITSRQLSRIEWSETNPSIDTLYTLADKLGLPPGVLLCLDMPAADMDRGMLIHLYNSCAAKDRPKLVKTVEFFALHILCQTEEADPFTCAYCGMPFDSYGNAHRKYCSHACYAKAKTTASLPAEVRA